MAAAPVGVIGFCGFRTSRHGLQLMACRAGKDTVTRTCERNRTETGAMVAAIGPMSAVDMIAPLSRSLYICLCLHDVWVQYTMIFRFHGRECRYHTRSASNSRLLCSVSISLSLNPAHAGLPPGHLKVAGDSTTQRWDFLSGSSSSCGLRNLADSSMPVP